MSFSVYAVMLITALCKLEVPCCTKKYCVVLCYIMLCCAVLCCAVLCCAVTAATWLQEDSSTDVVSRTGGKSRLRPTSSGFSKSGQVLTDEPESGVILFQKVWCVWC